LRYNVNVRHAFIRILLNYFILGGFYGK